jgi:hypothetical protein
MTAHPQPFVFSIRTIAGAVPGLPRWVSPRISDSGFTRGQACGWIDLTRCSAWDLTHAITAQVERGGNRPIFDDSNPRFASAANIRCPMTTNGVPHRCLAS